MTRKPTGVVRQPMASIEEVAVFLGVPVQTLYNWRNQGKGPRSARVGKHIRYRWSDVDQYIDANSTGGQS